MAWVHRERPLAHDLADDRPVHHSRNVNTHVPETHAIITAAADSGGRPPVSQVKESAVVSLLPAAGSPGTLATTAFHCALAEGVESIGHKSAIVGLALHRSGWKEEMLPAENVFAPWLPPLSPRSGDRGEARSRGIFHPGDCVSSLGIAWRLELLLERTLDALAADGTRILLVDTRSLVPLRIAIRCGARRGWKTIVISNEAMSDSMSDPSTRDSYNACVVGCADGVWVVSEHLADHWRSLGATEQRIFVAPSVVRPSSLQRPVAPSQGPTAAYVGNLAHREVDYLLDIAELVSARVTDFRLGIYGDATSETRGLLAERIEQRGLTNDVVLHAPMPPARIPAELDRWSVLLLPRAAGEFSTAGFPNKLGEYLASGRAVVTTAVGDIPRYLTDRGDVYLAPPDDPAAFSEILIRALSEPSVAAEVGLRGRAVAERLLGGSEVARRLLEFAEGLPREQRYSHSKRESLAALVGPDPALLRRDLVRLYRVLNPHARPPSD